MSKIIPCIHNDTKIILQVEYDGIEKTLSACSNCIDMIESSSICKIVGSETGNIDRE